MRRTFAGLLSAAAGAAGAVGCLPSIAVGTDLALLNRDIPADFALDQAMQRLEFAREETVINEDPTGPVATDHLLVRLKEQPVRGAVFDAIVSELRGAATGSATGIGAEVSSVFTAIPSNIRLAQSLGLDRWVKVGVPSGVAIRDARARLAALASVELVEYDALGGVTTGPPPDVNDVMFGSQWHLRNSGQTVLGQIGTAGVDIGASAAWSRTRGDSSVVVAVLDTGVSLSHPDLAGKLLPGFNAFSATGSSDDSWSLSHGTFCAGIIAANLGNTIGIAGIAPDCKILPVKVLNGSFGSESTVANGLVWATDHGADVANMSLGFTQGSTLFRDAVLYAHGNGVVLVSSTGNNPTAAIAYPAKWEVVLAVGATDNRDAAANFETVGPEMDICAPGVGITTTTDINGNLDGYSVQSGTSMSAPMVAAAAALVLSVNPGLSPDQVAQILKVTAVDLGPAGADISFGAGRLNVHAAVLKALSTIPYCIGDWNADGLFESDDVFEFLSTWFADGTDVNGDGISDADDIFSFLSSWFSECR